MKTTTAKSYNGSKMLKEGKRFLKRISRANVTSSEALVPESDFYSFIPLPPAELLSRESKRTCRMLATTA